MKTFAPALLAACVALSPLAANATLIHFDNVAAGTTLTNEYAAQGVTFTGAALVFTQPPYFASSPNGLAAGGNVFSAVFAWDVNHVEAVFLDSEIGSNIGSMTAYDANDAFLGSVTAITPAGASALLQLNYAGIRRVAFLAADDGAVVDNLQFTPSSASAVPEPSSLMLAGLALAAVCRAGRGRRAGQRRPDASPWNPPVEARGTSTATA